jgi:NADPH-dependent 2,4-dienoyl-CoA reductase/sulfur reductase-like enzyme
MASEQLVVVGGGVAGCSAALEAARLGLKVTLIDEHPQSLQAMSLDAPYFYGARLAAVLDDAGVISERVLGANDLLLECLDAGVEILTGTCCWGGFVPGPNNVHLKNPQLGVADGERSWLIDYDRLILASGSRDLVLSFPGWHLPGVLGANGASALLARYQALSGERMAILGSGNIGLRTARLALEKGVQVAAVVEVASEIRGDRVLAAELSRAGVPFLLSHTVEQVVGEQEVRGIRVLQVDSSLQPVLSSAQEISCDTVCMAVGVVPNIELASVSGCRIVFDAARGGWVPEVDEDFRTSIAAIHVVGDAAGTLERMHLDPAVAAEQGRRAACAVAGDVGLVDKAAETQSVAPEENPLLPGARAWLRSLVAAGGMDVVVCQCEEVTRRELLDVSPPKYLGAGNMRSCGGVKALSPTGQSSQDLIKRLTRAGMGHCQGKRCRDQTIMLLAEATGTDLSKMVPGSYRVPVRPLPLKIMWAGEETEETRRAWPIWLHPVEEGAPGYASARAAEPDRAKR